MRLDDACSENFRASSYRHLPTVGFRGIACAVFAVPLGPAPAGVSVAPGTLRIRLRRDVGSRWWLLSSSRSS